MNCIELVMKHPPAPGEYKVVNQFANVFSINELAEKISAVCGQLGIKVSVTRLKNPRKEAEVHYYNPDNQNLRNLGYIPSTQFEEEIKKLIQSMMPFKKRIQSYASLLDPTIKW